MKFLFSLLGLAGVGYGAYLANLHHPEIKDAVIRFVKNDEFHTLEARFTVEQIMEKNKGSLLKDGKYRFLEPGMKFVPYLLMESKYLTRSHRSEESLIIWDLIDGEMVLNTSEWIKTHGLSDCIMANVEGKEFRVLKALSERGEKGIDRDSLIRMLRIDADILYNILDSCKRKKLVVQSGSVYRIHVQNPRLNVKPVTFIDDRLVTKTCNSSERLGAKFSKRQIQRMAEKAFSEYNFATRRTLFVYLPVYVIIVQNPDGSVHTSYWNALNGRVIPFTSILE